MYICTVYISVDKKILGGSFGTDKNLRNTGYSIYNMYKWHLSEVDILRLTIFFRHKFFEFFVRQQFYSNLTKNNYKGKKIIVFFAFEFIAIILIKKEYMKYIIKLFNWTHLIISIYRIISLHFFKRNPECFE